MAKPLAAEAITASSSSGQGFHAVLSCRAAERRDIRRACGRLRGRHHDCLEGSAATPGPDALALGRQITSLLLHLYAMRMAAVFTMSTATITLRTKVAPRWIGMLGIAVAVVLLVSVGLTLWVALLFPAWILLLSVDILRTGLRRAGGAARTVTDTA